MIEQKINKMINEYEVKISEIDKLISFTENDIESSDDHIEQRAMKNHIVALNSQRQAYVQAKCDIESLLDFL